MDAHSQFIKDVLKAHLRSLNIRMAKQGLGGMTASGGRTGEPLVTDILRVKKLRGYAELSARFPTRPDQVPGVDQSSDMPERLFGLKLDANDACVRPVDGQTFRVETDHGTFRGEVFHDQAYWGVRWTADFSKSFGKGPASGGGPPKDGSPDEEWPRNAGFKYL